MRTRRKGRWAGGLGLIGLSLAGCGLSHPGAVAPHPVVAQSSSSPRRTRPPGAKPHPAAHASARWSALVATARHDHWPVPAHHLAVSVVPGAPHQHWAITPRPVRLGGQAEVFWWGCSAHGSWQWFPLPIEAALPDLASAPAVVKHTAAWVQAAVFADNTYPPPLLAGMPWAAVAGHVALPSRVTLTPLTEAPTTGDVEMAFSYRLTTGEPVVMDFLWTARNTPSGAPMMWWEAERR